MTRGIRKLYLKLKIVVDYGIVFLEDKMEIM